MNFYNKVVEIEKWNEPITLSPTMLCVFVEQIEGTNKFKYIGSILSSENIQGTYYPNENTPKLYFIYYGISYEDVRFLQDKIHRDIKKNDILNLGEN